MAHTMVAHVVCLLASCAIAAPPPAEVEGPVRREGDRLWIPGLEDFELGGFSYLQNTPIACLVGITKVLGEEHTYDELMGLSGAAFRAQITRPQWDPSAPEPRCGFDCMAQLLVALGRTVTWHEVQELQQDPARLAQLKAEVVASLERGRPVILYERSAGLGTGWQRNGEVILWRSPGAREKGYVPLERWPWTVGIVGPKGEAPVRRGAVLRSLEVAVELATTPAFGDYASGFAAYEAWAADLVDEERYAGKTPQELAGVLMANGWCYGSLFNARQCAEVYLRAVAKEFEEPVAEHLTAAADLYAKEQKLLAPGDPFPWDLFPWDFERKKTQWDAAVRTQQAQILDAALAVEIEAVDELKAALEAAKSVVVPATPAL